jgi:hypothetical protein
MVFRNFDVALSWDKLGLMRYRDPQEMKAGTKELRLDSDGISCLICIFFG